MMGRGLVAATMALVFAGAALAQVPSSAFIGRSIFDTPRFTIVLPAGFAEIRRYDKDQPLFYFSDSDIYPHSRRALTIMFFEGGDFADGDTNSMLETMAYGLAKQHSSFQISKSYYLDGAKKALCGKWSGDAGGSSFTGLGCVMKTRTGFVLLQAMDSAATFPAEEPTFKSAMLSFRLKG
jgi:hypothetical protein